MTNPMLTSRVGFRVTSPIALEETHAVAEQGGRQVKLELVEQAGLQVLARQ